MDDARGFRVAFDRRRDAARGGNLAQPGSTHSGQYGVRWKQIVDEAVDYYCLARESKMPRGLLRNGFRRHLPLVAHQALQRRKAADGRYTVTYNSVPEFRLDGANGNVMVEIPKHYSRRYISDGYEYRLISAEPRAGFIVDPAFVENGREIEKVYVRRYEAHLPQTARWNPYRAFTPRWIERGVNSERPQDQWARLWHVRHPHPADDPEPLPG